MLSLIKTLSGHSGCNLNLYKNGDKIFLRKDAGKPEDNRRLKKQFIKQKKFQLDYVKTPQVLNSGLSDKGVFYFDMEFINGITLSEYMKSIKIKEIVDLVTLLFNAFSIQEGKIVSNTQHIFQNKISDLSKKLDATNKCIVIALNCLTQYDFSGIPQSKCCGDLTLENIIISPMGGVYLIDFLDSFYNSWMIDVAKLLQDIELGWSYRKQERDFGLNLRLATAKQALIDNILQIDGGILCLDSIYHILLLNTLRIYPYTKDNLTLNFLNNAICHVLGNINDLKGK